MLRFARVCSQRVVARPLRLSRRAVQLCASQTPIVFSRGFRSTSVALQREDDEDKKRVESDGSDDELDDAEWDDEDEEDYVEGDDEEEEEELEAEGEFDEEAAAAAAEYMGVVYSPGKVKKYSAELELDGIVISGGDYWTALDAGKGYDELVDLYCDLDTPRNFHGGSEAAESAAGAVAASSEFTPSGTSEWEIPEVGKRNADIIEPIVGQYLMLDEVLAALEREKAINVYTVDLAGKSSLADYMIFTTGRSQAHMRRMADMMIQSMKARDIQDDFEYSVEGRDCDDWMIADCSNIVVHFMREDTRRILNLEDHWENMVNDKHRILGDMDEDEYMDKFGTSELMEYIDDDDFTTVEQYEADEEAASRSTRRSRSTKSDDVDWK